jgi:hypothetical protein
MSFVFDEPPYGTRCRERASSTTSKGGQMRVRLGGLLSAVSRYRASAICVISVWRATLSHVVNLRYRACGFA